MPSTRTRCPTACRSSARRSPSARSVAARLLRPHRLPRRDARGVRRVALPRTHGLQGHAAPHAPSTSTATSTASAPTTTPTPARRTPSSTRPCCPSTCRRPWTSSPTSCGPACAATTSTWRRRSSSKRSACTRTSRCGRPTTTPSSVYFADHPLGNSILGTTESITRPDPRPDARLLPAAATSRRTSPSSAAGNFDWDAARRAGRGALRRLGPPADAGRERHPRDGRLRRVRGRCTKEKVTQEHVILMAAGAAGRRRRCATPPTCWPWSLGDDSGSRLYWALVDPGLADSADMSFHEYEGTGAFYTSFSCEPGARRRRTWRSSARSWPRCSSDGITEEELRPGQEQDRCRAWSAAASGRWAGCRPSA